MKQQTFFVITIPPFPGKRPEPGDVVQLRGQRKKTLLDFDGGALGEIEYDTLLDHAIPAKNLLWAKKTETGVTYSPFQNRKKFLKTFTPVLSLSKQS